MRIAYIVHTFKVGGLEHCVARLADKLDRERFQPLVICLDRNGDAENWIERDDVPIIALNKKEGNDIRVVQRLCRVLRQHRVDVVHSHNWGTLVETALARRSAGVRWHVHAERGMAYGSEHVALWRRVLRDRVKKWAFRSTDAVVAVSESIRDDLASCGIAPASRITVIPNGVDVSLTEDPGTARCAIRRRLGIGDHAFVIGSIGRLVKVKDYPTIINAMAKLREAQHDVYLVIVGDGGERDNLRAHLEETGLQDRCFLPGNQGDVPRWLAAMDVYVNSSLSEGMSQAILEAMAAGLPIVTTDAGDSARLVNGDGSCGFVVQPGDSLALAERLTAVVTDPRLRVCFSQNARQRHLSCFATSIMLQRYENLYASLEVQTRTIPPSLST
jgi:sugar transferase (PEP-CTERM/EpsH1 system associated)